MYRRFGKRAFDLVVSIVGLAAISPLLLVTSLLVRVKLGMPVFFVQQRAGCRGRAFNLYKFRTMSDARDSSGALLPDEARRSSFGDAIRRLSIDELPQLLNVVRGEMSLIGPRPLSTSYLDRYTPDQARRHAVRPGITGWSQVKGRNSLGWDAKFKNDVWYVDHLGVMIDTIILAKTLVKVVACSDVAPESEFLGTKANLEQPDG
jgi:sugar transferase EpsL